MRHVPVAEFQNNISEFVAAAGAGEDVVVMQDGHEFLRLTRTSDDRMARQRAAVEAAYALGQEILRKHGPTTSEERLSWIKDDRR